MRGDEVIAVLLLPFQAGGKTQRLKSVLQVCADYSGLAGDKRSSACGGWTHHWDNDFTDRFRATGLYY